MTDATVSPVVLSEFYSALAMSDWARAMRAVTLNAKKERELKKTSVAFFNHHLLTVLNQLVAACQMHGSLIFLEYKWFRKNTLALTYTTLLDELARTEGMLKDGALLQSDEETRLIQAVCVHTATFLRARLELMQAYIGLASLTVPSIPQYLEIVAALRTTLERYRAGLGHPLFFPLKLGHEVEVTILLSLLLAQVAMCEYRFVDAVTNLFRAKAEFERWRRIMMAIAVDRPYPVPLQPGESQSQSSAPGAAPAGAQTPLPESSSASNPLLSSSSSVPTSHADPLSLPTHHNIPPLVMDSSTSLSSFQPPNTYKWLNAFHSNLLSKFALYFHHMLRKHTALDMKNLVARCDVDLVGTIRSFHRKTNALVSIVLCAEDLPFSMDGYLHPSQRPDPPTGMQCYPAIFSYPGERPLEHWPSVVSLITSNSSALSSTRRVYFFDPSPKVQSTYFITSVDSNVYCVVIFTQQKRQENDQAVIDFFATLSLTLRNTKPIQMLLKQG